MSVEMSFCGILGGEGVMGAILEQILPYIGG